MIPTYQNSSPSLFDPVEGEDQQHQVLHTAKPQASSSSSLSNNHLVFTYSIQDQQGFYHRELQHQLKYKPEANNFASEVRSHNHLTLERKKNVDGKDQNHQSDYKNGIPAKLMPLKIRLMHKMMNSDPVGTEEALPNVQLFKFGDHQKQPSSPLETNNSSNFSSCGNINSNNPIRVCSNCNTTKTPLWRSGPRGPKSLCNACGIRQRKARRAMAAAAAVAAAAASNGTILAAEATETSMVKTKAKVKHKEKRSKSSNGGHIAPHYKKRFKFGTTSDQGTKKICFEELLMSLSKNLASHRVFPQDEKEAAILLMALSCGLAHC